MISFDHVHVFCTDLDAMVEFWTKAFKADFVKYRKFGPADGAVLSLGGVQIFLKVIPADSPMPVGAARGCNHIGIRCDDPFAMADTIVNDFGGKKLNRLSDDCVFAAHPDGLVFELMRNGADI